MKISRIDEFENLFKKIHRDFSLSENVINALYDREI